MRASAGEKTKLGSLSQVFNYSFSIVDLAKSKMTLAVLQAVFSSQTREH